MYSYDIFAAVPCCAERLKVSDKLQKIFKSLFTFLYFSATLVATW